MANPERVAKTIAEFQPWALINTINYERVEGVEYDPVLHLQVVMRADMLARACAGQNIPVATFSSGRVFDGTLGRAYIESDQVRPVCARGESSAEAERKHCKHALKRWSSEPVLSLAPGPQQLSTTRSGSAETGNTRRADHRGQVLAHLCAGPDQRHPGPVD